MIFLCYKSKILGDTMEKKEIKKLLDSNNEILNNLWRSL